MKKAEFITIRCKDREGNETGQRAKVKRTDYVRAKTGDLRAFGYGNLKESDVEAQLSLLLKGKKWTDVVGAFIEKDEPKPVNERTPNA